MKHTQAVSSQCVESKAMTKNKGNTVHPKNPDELKWCTAASSFAQHAQHNPERLVIIRNACTTRTCFKCLMGMQHRLVTWRITEYLNVQDKLKWPTRLSGCIQVISASPSNISKQSAPSGNMKNVGDWNVQDKLKRTAKMPGCVRLLSASLTFLAKYQDS